MTHVPGRIAQASCYIKSLYIAKLAALGPLE